jgi:hypothetical protein
VYSGIRGPPVSTNINATIGQGGRNFRPIYNRRI